MDVQKVTTAVKITISIDRNKAKMQKLSADLSRLYRSLTQEERDEYKKRIL